MACGAPIRDEVADEAAAWLTRFMAGEVDDAARARWQQWRNSHPDHERAWRHIEAVSARLRGLDPGAACHSLALPRKPSHNAARRRLLGFAGGLTVLGGAGLLIGRGVGPMHELAADHRTAVGERREVTLADGSHIQLNTASAIDVRFSPDARVVRLTAGEIHVTTAEDVGAARPFLVETGHGTIRALGTRFTVRRHDDHTEVAVYQHAVEIMPADAPTALQRLQRGEAMNFTRGRAGPRILADAQATAWTRGLLSVDNQRLADFLEELGRYRRGVLRCAPEVADLRFSGVFPLDDPDRILAMLPNSLPVAVHWRTRWWVTVTPGQPDS